MRNIFLYISISALMPRFTFKQHPISEMIHAFFQKISSLGLGQSQISSCFRICFLICREQPFVRRCFTAEVMGVISAAVSANVVVLKNLFYTVGAGNYHFPYLLIGGGGGSRTHALSTANFQYRTAEFRLHNTILPNQELCQVGGQFVFRVFIES